MSGLETLAAAAGGLVLGRWVNLSIDRAPLPRQPESPATDTPRPNRRFTLLELVPFVSWAALWGTPPTARGWLRWRPPLVEVTTALLCGVIAYRYGLNLGAVLLALYCLVFVHLAVVDLEHTLILNLVVAPALVVAVAAFPFTPLGQGWGIGEGYLRSLGGAGVGFVAMLVVYVASLGRGLGAGDVKLAALLGGALGFPEVIAGLLAGFMAGGLVGLALLALRLRGRRDTIPYGPALVAGATVVLLAGPGIYQWYFSLFR